MGAHTTATEALARSSAQLSAAQRRKVEDALDSIDAHILSGKMEFRGCQWSLLETDGSVFTALVIELRALGWDVTFALLKEKSSIDGSTKVIGWQLTLVPNADAYRANTLSLAH